MYHFNYLHDQWLILSLGSGLILVLLIVLSYIAVWKPRQTDAEDRPVKASEETFRFVPWVLIVVYLAIFVYYFVSPFLWMDQPGLW